MPQLIGIILIFFACSAIGFYAADMYRQRCDELEAFLKLISHIRARIDYCRAPLDTIFGEYNEGILVKCGFIDATAKQKPSEAFAVCRRRLSITDSQADILTKFFAELGYHTAAEESAHCAYFVSQLSEMLSTSRCELPKITRLCRSFGILAGIMAAILLI